MAPYRDNDGWTTVRWKKDRRRGDAKRDPAVKDLISALKEQGIATKPPPKKSWAEVAATNTEPDWQCARCKYPNNWCTRDNCRICYTKKPAQQAPAPAPAAGLLDVACLARRIVLFRAFDALLSVARGLFAPYAALALPEAARELAASCGCLLKVNATGTAVRRSVFLSADQRFLQWAPSKKTDTANFSACARASPRLHPSALCRAARAQPPRAASPSIGPPPLVPSPSLHLSACTSHAS